MDGVPLAPAAAPLVLGGALPAPERATPEEAARGFEALLVGQMLAAQSRPLLGETPLSGGSAGQLYRELLFETFARMAAERGAFGLGRELAEEMRRPAARAEGEGGG